MQYKNTILGQNVILSDDNLVDLANLNNLNYNTINQEALDDQNLIYLPYLKNNKVNFASKTSMIHFIKNKNKKNVYNDILNITFKLTDYNYNKFIKINKIVKPYVFEKYNFLPINNKFKTIFLDRESIEFFKYHNYINNVINYVDTVNNLIKTKNNQQNFKIMIFNNSIKILNYMFDKYIYVNYKQFSQFIYLNTFYYAKQDIYDYITTYYPLPSINDIENVMNNDYNYLPYQSYDMAKKNIVRFGDTKSMEVFQTFRIETKKLLETVKNFQFDLTSDIDYYKTERYDNTSFKYIYQLSEFPIKNLVTIKKFLINMPNTFVHIFIPFVVQNNMEEHITLTQHKYYQNIQLASEDLFMIKIKNILQDLNKENEYGKLIYNLLLFFESLNLQEIKNVHSSKINILWSYNNNKLLKNFEKRNNKLQKLNEFIEMNPDIDCEKFYLNYFNEYDYVEKVTSAEIINKDILNACLYKTYNLKSMLDINKYKSKNFINICPSLKFNNSTDTFFGNQTINYHLNCENVIDSVKNPIIADGIKNYIKYLLNKSNTNEIKFNKENISDFKLYENYMPEWVKNIIDNNFDQAYENKQLFLGDLYYIRKIKRCNIIAKSAFVNLYPVINDKATLISIEDISWNLDTNKTILTCIMNNNLIFPIRFIININKISTYGSISNNIDENYIFLGNVITKINIVTRENSEKYYNTFLFLNKETLNIVPYNFRGNNTFHNIPGTDNFKVTYVELETLLYYGADYGINLHFYMIAETEDKENQTILVSKYSKEELLIKYNEIGLYDSVTNKQIVDELKEFILYKNYNKRFSAHFV